VRASASRDPVQRGNVPRQRFYSGPWVPGLAALARDTMVASVSISCAVLLFSRAASLSIPRRLSASASCLPLSSPPPKRGGWRSADRRTLLSYVARARRDDRVSETRAVPLQPGRPLGAPSWRFSAGDPCCRLRQWHRSRPATCPHQVKCLAGGVPDLPRCGSRRNRGTPLPAPSSGSSPETPPPSEDAKRVA
jgi:hypothetical protein